MKTEIAVFFGGRTPEHDVSIVSALQVMAAFDTEKYHVIPVYISVNGQLYTGERLRDRGFYFPDAAKLNGLEKVSIGFSSGERQRLVIEPASMFRKRRYIEFDVAFPVIHGIMGEDGNIQGYFETINVPYAGMRTLASAVLMDKIATKHFFSGSQIPFLPFREILRPKQGRLISTAELASQLQDFPFPLCVKPTNLGSSIGVARVENLQELSEVLVNIFVLDKSAIVEPFVSNLVEYNVSIRASDDGAITSAIEKPKCSEELLDFKEKYLSGSGKIGEKSGVKTGQQVSEGMLSLTREINPNLAHLDHKIRSFAIEAFELVRGSGAPRIDFIGDSETGEIWMNEVNPCPGSYGYYLWEAANPPIIFSELLDHLVQEALSIHLDGQLPMDPTPIEARLFNR